MGKMAKLPGVEFHVSRKARDFYQFHESLFSQSGNLIFANLHAVRAFVQKMNQNRDLVKFPEQAVKPGQITAMGLIDEIFHYVVSVYREQINKEVMEQALLALYDELGKVPIDQKLYESYTYSRAIIAAHTKVFFRILYGSTTCIASALEEEFLSLDPSVVSLHTYHDCNWISDECVESERAKHMNDPWYVLQEYECQWVARRDISISSLT